MKRILLTLCSLAFLTPAFAASVEDLEYETNYYGDIITITDCNNDASGELIIPETIDGKRVTEIGDSAFSGCSSLTSVTIPSSWIKIGEGAFSGCERLPKDNQGVQYESSAKKVLIRAPENLSGTYTIPSSVRWIASGAFNGCSNLTSVTIPSSVTSIGDVAFLGCSSLTSVTIPSSVTEIGDVAFSGCSSLTSVTIPSSVTKIGEGAFLGCTAIEEMIFKGPPPHVVPLRDEGKQSLERECGISNPETLPATKGYYLPEYAEAWENVLGGETGKWHNLQMEPLGGAMLE